MEGPQDANSPRVAYLPDVCLLVQACLDTYAFWNKSGRPELTPDVLADVLWSSRNAHHCDLIAAIEDGRCLTTTTIQETAKRTLCKAPHNWSKEGAEYMVTQVVGRGITVVDTHTVSELRTIGLDILRPKINDTAPEALAPLDRYHQRAEPGDTRVDLEDLIVLAQIAVLEYNGQPVEFATADIWCSVAAAAASIATQVVSYRYSRHTGAWTAHDLPRGLTAAPEQDIGAPGRGTQTPAHETPTRVNAKTLPAGTMKPRQVHRGPVRETKGITL